MRLRSHAPIGSPVTAEVERRDLRSILEIQPIDPEAKAAFLARFDEAVEQDASIHELQQLELEAFEYADKHPTPEEAVRRRARAGLWVAAGVVVLGVIVWMAATGR